jgi:outer membrane protein
MSGDARLAQHLPRRVWVLLALMVLGCLMPLVGLAYSASSAANCNVTVIPGSALSLARAVDLALCSNAEIQSAAASVRVRAAQVGEAHSEYWPTLSATATELVENTSYPGSSGPSTTDDAVTFYGALNWRLFDFGGRGADSKAAALLLQVALSTQDATVQKVLGSVVESYFDAVSAKELAKNKEEDATLGSETLASADRRVARGDASESDSFQARTFVARAALDLNRARGAYEKSLALLTYAIGLPPGTYFDVPEDADTQIPADDQSLSAWLEQARQRHPAITAARADVDAALAQVTSMRSSGKPTLDLQVNYYANGFPQQGLDNTRQRSTTVGVGITIPLFDGFLNRYKVREAEATVNVKQAVLVDTERVTLTEIVKAYADATAAQKNLGASQTLLDTAVQSQLSSKRRYDAGAADILEVLTTQIALADARQERVRCLADWRSSRLRLLATSGVLTNLTTGLP